MIRHFGVFQFKKEVSALQIDACFEALKGMVGQIEGLIFCEHGPYNGNEGLNGEFTHGFLMTFDSAEARDAYLPHPIHERVKELVVPCLEQCIVFDIEV